MHTVNTLPNAASTFLTRLSGQGLADERYVVERFKAMPTATFAAGPPTRLRRNVAEAPSPRSRRCAP